ncbi:acid protease [Trametes meyenii]|nr:acid protease [Trametes meyenii]
MFARLRLAPAAVALLAFIYADSVHALFLRRDASPVNLPFARRLDISGTAKLLEADQARARAFHRRAKMANRQRARSSAANVLATNELVDYVTTVKIGHEAQEYTLLIDTGSSNTWVGARADNPFIASSSTHPTGDLVAVSYASGSFSGALVKDTITLGPGFTVKDQEIGAANVSTGFQDIDGILGIGPADLTCGTLLPNEKKCIPTVTDNAFAQKLIPEHLVAISFEPSTSAESVNGQLTFGGVDPSKFTGELNFVPITSISPANQFVGIDQSINYGSPNGTTVLPLTAGVTDTGTSLLLIASDAFETYQNLTGAAIDETTGFLRITPDQYDNLQSLFFHIGDNTYEFTPNAQILPRALNTVLGGDPDGIYLVVNDLGSVSGQGIDFIAGMAFLERFYHVFDIAHNRVGFATTPFTNATTN